MRTFTVIEIHTNNTKRLLSRLTVDRNQKAIEFITSIKKPFYAEVWLIETCLIDTVKSTLDNLLVTYSIPQKV